APPQPLSRRGEAPQPPHAQAVAAAQQAGDRDDAVLLVRQEVRARALPAQREHGLADLAVREALEAMQAPAQRDVRNRLDVEHEAVHGVFMSTTAATTSSASSGRVPLPPPNPR